MYVTSSPEDEWGLDRSKEGRSPTPCKNVRLPLVGRQGPCTIPLCLYEIHTDLVLHGSVLISDMHLADITVVKKMVLIFSCLRSTSHMGSNGPLVSALRNTYNFQMGNLWVLRGLKAEAPLRKQKTRACCEILT